MDLVIGNGLIGSNLYWYIRGKGDVGIASRRDGLHFDFSDDSWELPDCGVVYVCAGITSTLECEDKPNETKYINVDQTYRLCKQLKDKGVFVVSISSERVFDGSKPYKKVDEEVCPTTEYGRQKGEVEVMLGELGDVCIVRFSKVIGWDVPLFEGWIKDLREGKAIHPISNMGMSPMPVSFAVDVLYRLGKQGKGGLYQVSGDRDISYDRVAYHLANYMGVDLGLVQSVEAKEAHPYTTLECNMNIDIPDSWETIQGWCKNRKRLLIQTQ